MQLNDILKEAVQRNASDVLISAGSPVTYHVHGALEKTEPSVPLLPADTLTLVDQMLDDEQRVIFERDWELDLGFELPGLSRFRASVFRQQRHAGAVLRLIPLRIPQPAEIGLGERLLVQLNQVPNGLILVTGPTGAGKSTTIASYLQYLNTSCGRPRHIVTIEDPIEYRFAPQDCVVDQREVGIDTKDYVIGLRSALRQMPHIIFVGEMRDRQTMEIALTAAETGNIVISTLSTQSAAKTVNRIIDVFPIHDQAEIRTRLALSLRAVISQVLLRRIDMPGRVAAREVMFVTSAIANMVREGKIHHIDNAISSSYGQGMILMDDSLLQLHHDGIISMADVAMRLQDPEKARHLTAK